MNPEPYTFRRANWKSFRVLAGFIAPLLMLLLIFESGGGFLAFLSFFLFAMAFAKPWELVTKITIDSKGIESKGISASFFYSWKSIESTDIFYTPKLKTAHYGIGFVEDTTYSGDDFKFEKRIFVSTKQMAIPSWYSNLSENYLDFQYDEKAWRLINFYLAQFTEA